MVGICPCWLGSPGLQGAVGRKKKTWSCSPAVKCSRIVLSVKQPRLVVFLYMSFGPRDPHGGAEVKLSLWVLPEWCDYELCLVLPLPGYLGGYGLFASLRATIGNLSFGSFARDPWAPGNVIWMEMKSGGGFTLVDIFRIIMRGFVTAQRSTVESHSPHQIFPVTFCRLRTLRISIIWFSFVYFWMQIRILHDKLCNFIKKGQII